MGQDAQLRGDEACIHPLPHFVVHPNKQQCICSYFTKTDEPERSFCAYCYLLVLGVCQMQGRGSV